MSKKRKKVFIFIDYLQRSKGLFLFPHAGYGIFLQKSAVWGQVYMAEGQKCCLVCFQIITPPILDFPRAFLPSIIQYNLKKKSFLSYFCLSLFCKANETILSMKEKFQIKPRHKIHRCMKTTRNHTFLVSDHVPVWWNKSYNRFCSYHLQDKLDKWEEITSYFSLLAYNGALNISGFGL